MQIIPRNFGSILNRILMDFWSSQWLLISFNLPWYTPTLCGTTSPGPIEFGYSRKVYIFCIFGCRTFIASSWWRMEILVKTCNLLVHGTFFNYLWPKSLGRAKRRNRTHWAGRRCFGNHFAIRAKILFSTDSISAKHTRFVDNPYGVFTCLPEIEMTIAVSLEHFLLSFLHSFRYGEYELTACVLRQSNHVSIEMQFNATVESRSQWA